MSLKLPLMVPELWRNQDDHGHAVASYGVVNVINGEVFIDDIPLAHHLQQYDGRPAAFEFVFLPEFEQEYPIDAGILPLVSAIRALGLRTMSSCQGHTEMRGDGESKRPFVSFYESEAVERLFLFLPEGWEITEICPGILRLQPSAEPEGAQELARQQKEADELAKEICGALAAEAE